VGPHRRSVLLIEVEAALRELEELILGEAGYDVKTVPANVDPIAAAKQTCPDVIVIGLTIAPLVHPLPPRAMGWHVVDALEANPATTAIPVVVISTGERTAAEAFAAPNVRELVVSPYDIDALRDAVAKALNSPPPAALLPPRNRATPTAVRFAAEAVLCNARLIVLRTAAYLQQNVDPYCSHFAALTAGLIDNIPVMFGAIAEGMLRNLTPEEVFGAPGIKKAIRDHATLRQQQGLGPATVLLEYTALRNQTTDFLRSKVGSPDFSARDALDVFGLIDAYTDTLIRMVLLEFILQRQREAHQKKQAA